MGIQIGNGNKIKNSTIAENIETGADSKEKRFYDKHPWISGIIISVLAGAIVLFSFWQDIVNWIEGCF